MTEPSALQHVNRLGQVFYLQQGTTPAGKPRYYAGKKLAGSPMDAMPAGYEFYERPDNGQVVLRKFKRSSITEVERKQVEEIVRRASGLEHFMVEIDGNALVVHAPQSSQADNLIGVLASVFVGLPSAKLETFRKEFVKKSQYMKTLRFELLNPKTREFGAKRWCSLGSIDSWIELLARGPLAVVVELYAKQLDRENPFDMI